MESASQTRGQSIADRQAFDGLLAALHADRSQAAMRYERLRARLMFFFRRREFVFADRLADDVLTRVGQQIHSGEQIGSIDAYIYGVAQRVAYEETRRAAREVEAETTYARNILPGNDTPNIEALESAMEICLKSKSASERDLLFAYYASRGQEQIDRRKRLAESLSLSQGALRKRVFRLREGIEGCVRSRLANASGKLKNGN